MSGCVKIDPILETVMAECAEVGRYLWERGWAERNAGNISVDITDTSCDAACVELDIGSLPYQRLAARYLPLAGRTFLVTGTGKRMRDLAQQPRQSLSIVRVSPDGAGYYMLWRADAACWPTSEFNSHLGIHQLLQRKNAPQKAVLHTHPNELIALTHLPALCDEAALNRLLWAMHPETKIMVPEGAGLVPYHPPGSAALEAATVFAMEEHRIVLWEKHGAVAVGADVFAAFDLIDTLNKSAQLYFLCRIAGAEPAGLSAAQVVELERIFGRRFVG